MNRDELNKFIDTVVDELVDRGIIDYEVCCDLLRCRSEKDVRERVKLIIKEHQGLWRKWGD